MEEQILDVERGRSNLSDDRSFLSPVAATFLMSDYRPQTLRQMNLRTVIEQGTAPKQLKGNNAVIQCIKFREGQLEQVKDWIKDEGLSQFPLFDQWLTATDQPGYNADNDPAAIALLFMCKDPKSMYMTFENRQQAFVDVVDMFPATIHDFVVLYKMYCHLYRRAQFETQAPVPQKSISPSPAAPPASPPVALQEGLSIIFGNGKALTSKKIPTFRSMKVVPVPKTFTLLEEVQNYVICRDMLKLSVFADLFGIPDLCDKSPVVVFWHEVIPFPTYKGFEDDLMCIMNRQCYSETGISVSDYKTRLGIAYTRKRMQALTDSVGYKPPSDPPPPLPLVEADPSVIPHSFDSTDVARTKSIHAAANGNKLLFSTPLDAVNHLVKHGTRYKKQLGFDGKITGEETRLKEIMDLYLADANRFIAIPDSLVIENEVDVTLGRFAYTFASPEFRAVVTCNPDGSDPNIATFFPDEREDMVNDNVSFVD